MQPVAARPGPLSRAIIGEPAPSVNKGRALAAALPRATLSAPWHTSSPSRAWASNNVLGYLQIDAVIVSHYLCTVGQWVSGLVRESNE